MTALTMTVTVPMPVTAERGVAAMGETERASDDALLRAMQRGDAAGLEGLYDRYAGLAFGLACRMVGDRGVAEDIVQDAFLNAWRQAGSFDPRRGAARAWLMTIVHHRAIDWLRGRGCRGHEVPLTVIDHYRVTPDVWPTVATHVEREVVRRALAALPREQQQAVLLAYLGGYSQPEIAAAVGVPLTTVKGRLRLALQKLRVVLAEAVA